MANVKRAIELSVPIGKSENDRSASLEVIVLHNIVK